MGTRMRALALAKSVTDGLEHGMLFRIDTVLWMWVERLKLWRRWSPSQAFEERDVFSPHPEVAKLVRVVCSSRPRVRLHVARDEGLEATVGGVEVDRDALAVLGFLHGELTWSLHDEWLVARAGKQVEVLWGLEESQRIVETRRVLHDGEVWVVGPTYACMLSDNLPEVARARVLRQAERVPEISEKLRAMIAEAGGEIVRWVKINHVIHIGSIRVPEEAFDAVRASYPNLTWTTAPRAPATGWRGTKAVAFIVPLAGPQIVEPEPPARPVMGPEDVAERLDM